MFLNMMTTQLKNQDPMSPMNSDQFAVELATFSGVEQQTKTNDLLTQLLSSADTQSMAQMAGWVGDEARVSAPVHFDGNPVTLSPSPSADADQVHARRHRPERDRASTGATCRFHRRITNGTARTPTAIRCRPGPMT